MLQEIGLVLILSGFAGAVLVAEALLSEIIRRRPPPQAAIDRHVGALPAVRPGPVAEDLFSELFALRAEVAAMTRDVRSLRRKL